MVFEHGCLNQDERDEIGLPGYYELESELKVCSSHPVYLSHPEYPGSNAFPQEICSEMQAFCSNR